MKKVGQVITTILLILFIACILILAPVGAKTLINQMNGNSFAETKIVQKTNNGYIDLYVDTDTNVVYVRAVNGTLTPMINADGSPKLWDK